MAIACIIINLAVMYNRIIKNFCHLHHVTITLQSSASDGQVVHVQSIVRSLLMPPGNDGWGS